MQLSTVDRRTVIEDLLDIQIFSTMAGLLKDKIALNKNALQDVDYQLNLLEDKVSVQENYIDKVKENVDAQLKEINEKIIETAEQIEHHKTQMVDLELQASELFEQCEPLESVSNRIQQFLTLEGQIERKITNLKKQLKFYEDNTECPTCGQEITDEFKGTKTEEANTAITETTSGLEQLEAQIASNSTRMESLKAIKEQAEQVDSLLSLIHI